MKAPIIVRCPNTGQNAQVNLYRQKGDEREQRYTSILCPACAGIHYVNEVTGKILGQ